MDSTALMKLDKGGMVARIEQAKWPQALKPEEKALVATVAMSYGLDPILNELSIYQGRPYPTVNAWYRKSQETGKFDGMDSRPANKKEREERNAKEGDLLYRCEVWRTDASHPFVGWGRVRAEERKGDAHLPIVKDPDRMAEKRSEMQAMRKAFSIPMPAMSFEEVIETESGLVNKGTGEIVEEKAIEGEFKELPEEKLEEPPPSDSIVNLEWLKESMQTLQTKGIKAYSDESMLGYMRLIYKGLEGDTIYEIASKLDKGMATHFTKVIQDALDKA